MWFEWSICHINENCYKYKPFWEQIGIHACRVAGWSPETVPPTITVTNNPHKKYITCPKKGPSSKGKLSSNHHFSGSMLFYWSANQEKTLNHPVSWNKLTLKNVVYFVLAAIGRQKFRASFLCCFQRQSRLPQHQKRGPRSSMGYSKGWELVLMVKKSGDHQLRLVVYPMFTGF